MSFHKAETLEELAVQIGCQFDFLKALTTSDQASFYKVFEVPKRRGGTRKIYAPCTELKLAQRDFARQLHSYAAGRQQSPEYPHPAAHGFVKQRGTVSNASVHRGRRRVFRLDLKNFFNTISTTDVQRSLRSLNFQPEVANGASLLCTVSGFLPQGAPSSPILANLVMAELDEEFSRLASGYDGYYTRYADDITFSFPLDADLPPRHEIRDLALRHGLRLAEDKTQVSIPGQAHFVTGLSVSLEDRTTVPRWMKADLRQSLYFIQKYGMESHAEKRQVSPSKEANRIEGLINYIYGVEPSVAQKFRVMWHACGGPQQNRFGFAQRRSSSPIDVLLIVDEAVFKEEGIFSLCICEFNSDPKPDGGTTLQGCRDKLQKIARSTYADPFAAGRKHYLKKGLHYADDSEDLRRDVNKEIASFPFRAFVAFDKYEQVKYEESYLQLLQLLLKNRFQANHQSKITLLIEQNNKIKPENINRVLQEVKDFNASVDWEWVDKKSEPLVAIPDYCLGTLFALRKNPGDRTTKLFERLRDRYSYIYDGVHRKHYNRKNPFPVDSDFPKVMTITT